MGKNVENIEVKLSKKFYDKKSIEKAKKAFHELCKCEINEDKNYFKINICPKENQTNLQFKFANYVLGLKNG